MPKVPGGKRISPVIVGCVDYEFGTALRHHQTKFIYEVRQPIHSVIDVNQPVLADQVELDEYGFGGFVAD
jgi:hypothetical protein